MRFFHLLATTALLGCHSDVPDLEPLIGRWTASDALFEQRSLQFMPDGWIVFDQGQGQREVCRVRSVDMIGNGDGNERDFRVEYESPSGEEASLSLILDSAGALRLKNRRQVSWSRASE